jgi:ribonuclease HI
MMKVYFDGGCVPNPGAMSVCVVFETGKTFSEIDFAQGTNNIAEWGAMLWACELCISNNQKDVRLIGDSMLVVMQATEKWKIKHKDFLPFKAEFDAKKKLFTKLELVHVKREHNLAGHYLESVGR